MRVKSAIDRWIMVVLLLALASSVSGIFTATDDERLLVGLISGLAAGLVVWILRETYYELKEDHLFCRSGPITVRVPYDQVRSVHLSESLRSSLALSLRRIEIIWHDQAGHSKTVLISPENREEFLLLLLEKCPHIQNKQV